MDEISKQTLSEQHDSLKMAIKVNDDGCAGSNCLSEFFGTARDKVSGPPEFSPSTSTFRKIETNLSQCQKKLIKESVQKYVELSGDRIEQLKQLKSWTKPDFLKFFRNFNYDTLVELFRPVFRRDSETEVAILCLKALQGNIQICGKHKPIYDAFLFEISRLLPNQKVKCLQEAIKTDGRKRPANCLSKFFHTRGCFYEVFGPEIPPIISEIKAKIDKTEIKIYTSKPFLVNFDKDDADEETKGLHLL